MNKKLITLDGYDEMTRIFSKLKIEKAHWVVEKQIAAQQGDRSENAEYIAAKENIRNIDKRLYKLDWIINNTTAVDISKRKNTEMILFGSEVKLLKDDEKEFCVKIVGTHELIYTQKINDCLCISNVSPMGIRLSRMEVGDEFELKKTGYEVLEIK